MANRNKFSVIGRLTRDPEMRTFQNGGRLAQFGIAFAGNLRKLDNGQWDEETVFMDCKAFNAQSERGPQLADVVNNKCGKGTQVMIDGKIRVDNWNDKTTGEKRTKIWLEVKEIQILDRAKDGANDDGGSQPDRRDGSPDQDAPGTNEEVPF
jgi:single-strand DNA-binding protein